MSFALSLRDCLIQFAFEGVLLFSHVSWWHGFTHHTLRQKKKTSSGGERWHRMVRSLFYRSSSHTFAHLCRRVCFVRGMASSVEILCASEDTGFRPRRRPQYGASIEGTVFLVGVAVQTFLTTPKYADGVAQLLASTGPAPSLPVRVAPLVLSQLSGVQRCEKLCLIKTTLVAPILPTTTLAFFSKSRTSHFVHPKKTF